MTATAQILPRRKRGFQPKGRQADPEAVAEVAGLIGEERGRDLLIEHLHTLQDHYGALTPKHLAALAETMRLALVEVYEVATFYAHFDVLEDDQPIPPVTVRVCDSIACNLAGAEQLLAELERDAGKSIRVLRAPCMGRCDQAPVAAVGHNHLGAAEAGEILEAAAGGHVEPEIPTYIALAEYRAGGGYQQLQACLDGQQSLESVLEALDQSGLRGLGGAGFPTGRKWRIVRDYPAPRLMAVNADEGEPGTFKDRHYLTGDPHRFLEGMLIAAWAVEIETIYLYVRDEYPELLTILKTELAHLAEAGLAKHVRCILRRGAGAYICGEESAMIESLEGKRGLPRNRPPYVAEIGLFGRPTLAQNVETLYWVRDILERGPTWFSEAGVNGRTGRRSFSVSGRVKEPGVKLAPAGIGVRQLIDEYCGGMQDGHTFKGYLPGGASGGILPASLGDVPLDFDTLQEHGCFIGSAAVVVFSQADNMRDVALNLMKFFADESCGQCTPCRLGTEQAVQLMERPGWDTGLLGELSTVMADASICGLGQAAGNPINCVLKYFPEDVREDS